MDSLAVRKIISSFSFMSGATLLTIIMGMATNKMIAVFAGTEGIGIVGLFRNFLGFVVPVLTAGTTTVIVQMISTSSTPKKMSEIVSSVFNLFFFQVIVAVLAAIFLSGYISSWLFPTAINNAYVDEIRIVFAMAIAVLFSQSMIALINGKVNLKKVTVVNIVTALSTLVLTYPLVQLGGTGLAFIVGSGSIVGSVAGLYYVRKIYKNELHRIEFSLAIIKNIRSFPVSIWLLVHPLIVSATFLNIQVIVNKYYGINDLGIYTAVAMLETTTIMLLMAAMKTYYLPTLGQMKTQLEKEDFVNKVLSLLILAVFPFVITLIFCAKIILWLLFSKEFQTGSNILAIQSMAMLAQVFSWCYAMYLLHEGRYGIYLIIDSIWAIFLFCSMWYVASNGYPLIAIPTIYFIGSIISLMLYIVTAHRLYGKGMLNKRNIVLGLVAFLTILLAYFINQTAEVITKIFFVIIISGSFFYFIGINYKKIMSQNI